MVIQHVGDPISTQAPHTCYRRVTDANEEDRLQVLRDGYRQLRDIIPPFYTLEAMQRIETFLISCVEHYMALEYAFRKMTPDPNNHAATQQYTLMMEYYPDVTPTTFLHAFRTCRYATTTREQHGRIVSTHEDQRGWWSELGWFETFNDISDVIHFLSFDFTSDNTHGIG